MAAHYGYLKPAVYYDAHFEPLTKTEGKPALLKSLDLIAYYKVCVFTPWALRLW